LKEAGYIYVMDWPCDDQPIWLRTRSGPLLSVPYPVELNDSPQVIHRQHTGREFCDMLIDQFEEMVEQSEKHPLVCNVSIHPYVFGYPFRLRPLRQAGNHSGALITVSIAHAIASTFSSASAGHSICNPTGSAEWGKGSETPH
jgi:hypothetical protein